MKRFFIDKRRTHVGLIQYGADARILQNLRDSTNARDTTAILQRASQSQPGRNLPKMLRLANQVYQRENGAPAGFRNILILFMDSIDKADDGNLKALIGQLLANKVHVVAIGFRNFIDRSDVRNLFGDEAGIVLVRESGELGSSVVQQVIGQLDKGWYRFLDSIRNV